MQYVKYGSVVAALLLVALGGLTGCASTNSLARAVAPATGTSEPSDADGYIPDGTALTLDSDKPAIRNLRPSVLDALKAAEPAAEARGARITIADGWRSHRYQEYLFARAVQNYGSKEEASKWVRPSGESAHETGAAVDVATADAMDFLNRFGSEWGICQVYANEMWHFELLTRPGHACPALLADGRG